MDGVRQPAGARRSRGLLAGYGIAVAADTALYYAVPGQRIVTWALLGLLSTAAIGYGAWRHRPSRRLPWLLLAVAVLAFVSGDTIYNVLTGVLGEANPFPSVADAFYLATYPLFAAGMLVFNRRRNVEADRGSLLDAAVVTAGVGLLSWVYLMVPYVRSESLTVFQKVVSVAYPLGDVLVLAMLVRLLVGGGLRTRSLQMLTLGGFGLLVADALYGWIQLHGNWAVGGPVDLGWVAYYGLWGAAALHPSMTELTRPQPVRESELRRGRLVLLAAASLIAPGVLLAQSVAGHPRDAAVIAGFAVVLFLLVLARMSGVVARHRRAVARERALRSAATALVAASDPAAVWAAFVAGVAGVRDAAGAGTVRTVALAGEQPLGPARPAELARVLALVSAADGDHVRDVPADRLPAFGPELPGDGEEALAVLLARSPAPPCGAVVVQGDALSLAALRSSLETLGAQASVALDRVLLAGEVATRRAEGRFRSLIQRGSDMILLLDAEDRVVFQTPSTRERLGYRPEQLHGRPVTALVAPGAMATVAAALRRLRRAEEVDVADWRLVCADGRTVEVEVVGNDLSDDPDVGGLVLTLRDVTERRRLERELTHRAFHDALTGLANRDLFADRTEHALRRSDRRDGVVGVLLVDVDDFKFINDTLGHAVGDQLLLALAERLRSAVRAGDTVARLGGDEFAVLVEEVDDPAEVTLTAERVLAALSGTYDLAGGLTATVSVGVATSRDGRDQAELLRCADLALYAAKELGKHGWHAYEGDLHTGMVERLAIRAGLAHALDNDEFVVYYQPIVDLTAGSTLTGVEALVRWAHPDRGMVGPAEFIGVAEETGLIVPLGGWVLDRAVAQVAAWNQARPAEPLRLSVNVSPRQLFAGDFPATVRECLRAHQFAGELLTLELTEGVLLRDDGVVAATLAELRRMGVHLAVDDFGTGYSALGYLRDFPVTTLKIDRSFISQMPRTPQHSALVNAIIRMAESLDLKVVAEGIEHIEQEAAVGALGCQFGQGYLYARPLPAGELERMLPPPSAAAGPELPAPRRPPRDARAPAGG